MFQKFICFGIYTLASLECRILLHVISETKICLFRTVDQNPKVRNILRLLRTAMEHTLLQATVILLQIKPTSTTTNAKLPVRQQL